MISAHDNADFTFLNGVDQPVLGRNPARPETAEIVFERLWFSQAIEGFALNGFDQQVDSLEPGPVVLLEPQIVFPTFRSELNIHSSMSCLVLVFPARRLPIDLISRSALAGERSR